MENRDHSVGQEIITRENLPAILTKIGDEGKKKGTSEAMIPYIHAVREKAEKLGETSIVVQLYQEEFLSAQHMVMEERSKGFKANPIRAAKGILHMEFSSRKMEKYTSKNAERLDPVVRTRIFRFLGKSADYKGQYKKSERYYRKGLEYFEHSVKVEERYNRLEFLGFLSYSLVKQDKTEEGIKLAQQTLTDFDTSEEGKWLKENDYYVWAVWKSGIEIRTVDHIIKTNDSAHLNLIEELLIDAESILKMSDGTRENFRHRLDELDATKNRIKY